MNRFCAGLIIGLLIGIAGSASAGLFANSNGYALDWTVTKDGEEICWGPYIWAGLKEIECD